MSDPNEQGKLTPDSFNGYDGSSTYMSEENKSDQPENSENKDNEKKDHENDPQVSAEKDGEEEPSSGESGKKKSAWTEMFSALVASMASKKNPTEEKLFEGAIKSYTRALAQDVDTSDKEDPNKNVAKFLKTFLTPKETTQHTTDKEREQSKETREIFHAILESVRDLEETEETGLNEDKVLKELAKMTKGENKQLPETKEDRFKELEKNVKETLDGASEETLETLFKEWEALRKSVADKTELDEAAYDKVLEAETLLAELTSAETKEHKGYAEMDEAVRREYDRVYAQFAFDVAAAMLRKSSTREEVELHAGEPIDPSQHASWVSSFIFMHGEDKASREERIGKLLKDFPLEGNSEEQKQTAAIRGQIIEDARASGLNLEKIFDFAAQTKAESKREQDHEFEDLPELSEFEQLIEQDILYAKPEKIEDIQKEWKKLLKTPGLDAELKKQAEEAVRVLQNIYNLKKMVEEKESGQPVINRHLEPPKNFREGSEEQPETEQLQKPGEEQFVQSLLELIKGINPDEKLTPTEVKAITLLLQLGVVTNRRTKEDLKNFLAEKKIAAILFAFPVDHENEDKAKIAKKIRKQSGNYAYDEKLNEDEISKELKRLEREQIENTPTQRDPFLKLRDIVEETITKADADEAKELQVTADELVEKITPDDTSLLNPAFAVKDSLGKVVEAKEKPGKESAAPKDQQSETDIKEETEKRQDLKKLQSQIKSIENEAVQDHLRELVQRLSEGMTPGQMEKALKDLNKIAHSVASELKSEITDEHTTTQLKQKMLELFAFESNINEYRKFLLGEINRDKLDAFEKNVPELQEVLAETERVNGLETFKSINVGTFEKYIHDLTEVLKALGSLSAKQINAISLALQTQEAIVRADLLEGEVNNVVSRFVTAADLFEAVQKLQADLHGHEVRLFDKEFGKAESDAMHREIETDVRHKDEESAGERGYVFHGQRTALNPTILRAPQGSRYYEPGTPFVIGEQIEKIENAPTQATAAPNTPEAADYRRDYAELAQQSKEQRNYAQNSNLERLSAQLTELMNAGLQQHLSFSQMKEAQELARIIGKQRAEVMAMEQMYKGRHDERDYPEADAALYEGYIHTALGQRLKRIRSELKVRNGVRNGTYVIQGGTYETDKHGITRLRNATYVDENNETQRYDERTDEDLKAYYLELRKWTKILLKNDGRNGGEVQLSNQDFASYSDIMSDSRKNLDLNTASGQQTLLQDANWLFDPRGGNFLRYFMKNSRNPKGIDPEKHDSLDINPDKLLGVDYRHAEGTSSFGLPKSLEDSMEILARQYTKQEGTNYKTGGDRELIDGEGNFKYNNLYYLIREQINADIDYNKDGQINPFQKINLKGDASQVTLQELLLLVPEYLSQRNFEIKMHDNEIVGGWGIPTEHPEFSWKQANQLGAEIEFRVLTHEVRIAYITASRSGDKTKFLELMGSLHNSNHWSRGGKDGPNVLWLLGLPSSVVDGNNEIDKVFGKEEMQGSLGKAISDMLMGYYYLTDMTDFYETKEHGTKHEKDFNENMFYKLWEPNGSMTFLTTLSEESLGRHREANVRYSGFIKRRVEAAATAYGQNMSIEERTKLDQIKEQITKKLDHLQELEKAKISFTENDELTEFHKLVQKEFARIPRNSKEELALRVRDDILDHLKSDYFASLYDMEVPKIDSDPAHKDLADASGLYLRTKGKTTFGEMALKKDKNGRTTYSMKDMLEEFDPEQIREFDYKNSKGIGKGNDPLEIKRGQLGKRTINDLTVEEAQEALAEHMDKNNPNGNRRHELFKHNEKMMLAFTSRINRIPRKWLNHMRDIPENEDARELLQAAMKKCVEKAHGIDSMESMYAWTQARDYMYIWGIAESNDVGGIGFRAYGKLLNFGEWRSHRGSKDGFGNEETVEEFHALSLPFLHALRILDLDGEYDLGHQSVWSVIQGGHGKMITPRALRQFKQRSRYRTPHDAEELYVANNLTNALNLVDLIQQTEMDFAKIVQIDKLGNVVFDYDEAFKLFKTWRKSIRYALQKNNLDYREIIYANGKETSLYRHFFGKKTRAINELKKRELAKRPHGKKKGEDWIDDDHIYKEPADAMLLNIIAAEVSEHRKMHGSAHHWTIENVMELEYVFTKFMHEIDREEDEEGEIETHAKQNTFTHKLFNSALKAYDTAYYRMHATQLNSSFWAGLFTGLWAGIKATGKGKWVW